MHFAARLVLMCLLGIAGLLAGCTSIPYSFRIEPAAALEERILLPPGAEYRDGDLVLHVERDSQHCQRRLPTVETKEITVSNVYWPKTRSYFLKISIPKDSAPHRTFLPAARCLNTSVRGDADCPQSTIAKKVVSALGGNSAWMQCIPSDAEDLAAEILHVLPHRASGSGALSEERTYAPPPSPESVEVIQLLPGATVCVNRDYFIVPNYPTAWVSSRPCTELLNAPGGGGKVVLSRTDTDRTFPYASELFKSDGKVHEARSWLAVRAALALNMPGGAYMYAYYSGGSGMHNKPPPSQGPNPWSEDMVGRSYPAKETVVTPPIPLTPILLVRTKRLELKGSEPPSLDDLCMGSGDEDKRHCFAFPDFASIDVLRSFSVAGRVHFAPSGTLTSDVPEIRLSRSHTATRIFRGRAAPILFDVSEQHNAIPLAAGDRFGGQP